MRKKIFNNKVKFILVNVIIILIGLMAYVYISSPTVPSYDFYQLTPTQTDRPDQADRPTVQGGDAIKPPSGLADRPIEPEVQIDASGFTAEPIEGKEIVVYVHGCVQQQGVYHLHEGQRIYEVLALAGGLTQEALIGYVNLAQRLQDGDSIYFPKLEEKDKYVLGGSSSPNAETPKLININQATVQELTKIPGIGQAKADSIIRYRQENGPFANIKDIMKIRGIKEGVFEMMKEYITVDG